MKSFWSSNINYEREHAFNRSMNSNQHEKAKKFIKIDFKLNKLNSW